MFSLVKIRFVAKPYGSSLGLKGFFTKCWLVYLSYPTRFVALRLEACFSSYTLCFNTVVLAWSDSLCKPVVNSASFSLLAERISLQDIKNKMRRKQQNVGRQKEVPSILVC